jgi:hypothetical protein
VTYQFNQISDDKTMALPEMKMIISKHYKVLLAYLKRTARWGSLSKKPLLIAFPDVKIGKNPRKYKLKKTGPNNGRHFHAFLVIPDRSLLSEDLLNYVWHTQTRYPKEKHMIKNIEVSIITKADGSLASYCSKHVKSHVLHDDDILVRPKSLADL